jgi:hypothetical protein
MLLPVLALVLAVPQLAGYVVTRFWRGAGRAEWVGAAVASYAAIWYATCHSMLHQEDFAQIRCGVAPRIAWGLLASGLVVELMMGLLLAGVVFHLRASRGQRRTPPAS